VFEANRLVVKEADGHERYESGGGMKSAFSDGSMEQDLPMQQLSEMFNINHFLVRYETENVECQQPPGVDDRARLSQFLRFLY
jgi:hypothetical protein